MIDSNGIALVGKGTLRGTLCMPVGELACSLEGTPAHASTMQEWHAEMAAGSPATLSTGESAGITLHFVQADTSKSKVGTYDMSLDQHRFIKCNTTLLYSYINNYFIIHTTFSKRFRTVVTGRLICYCHNCQRRVYSKQDTLYAASSGRPYRKDAMASFHHLTDKAVRAYNRKRKLKNTTTKNTKKESN